ncbi:hypothetical protein IFM89_008631 [Coptis chinensis]|uniref:Receptor-like serine/threonine-protein kinase n=1 Tax=Coptis chinensis TaxID=261450 RepID=A0A835GWQ4_9MAGN|nr:hypothetical protein IFM89_008631 [Coptis chinensis]
MTKAPQVRSLPLLPIKQVVNPSTGQNNVEVVVDEDEGVSYCSDQGNSRKGYGKKTKKRLWILNYLTLGWQFSKDDAWFMQFSEFNRGWELKLYSHVGSDYKEILYPVVNEVIYSVISVTLLSIFSKCSISANTLVPKQSLKDGQTLVSEGQRFELGFFSPKYSKNRYLGIWYKNISLLTVVWVANRNTPVTNSSGVFMMHENGNFLLLNQDQRDIWSSKLGNPRAQKPIAKLLNSGNFVVMEKSDDDVENNFIWQSFDHATDTLLPGMKLGWDLNTGLNNSLVSWKSVEDPSIGDYSLVIEPHGSPEAYLLQGQIPIFRSGPWNGIQFSGDPVMKSKDGYSFSFIYNKKQTYFSIAISDESIISRLIVDEVNQLQILTWFADNNYWKDHGVAARDQCDRYNQCGAYGICDPNKSPVCKCTKEFEPKNLWDWKLGDGSSGCVQKKKFECGKDDGFLEMKRMKLPDTLKTFVDLNMNLKECKEMCETNCSLKVARRSMCGSQHQNSRRIQRNISKRKSDDLERGDHSEENKKDDLELPLVDFAIIAATTENFSSANKLGQGGFGSVYKGTLADGQQIAVKRLSTNSVQGIEELKNEVKLIAKLQHRNLVRLLGCCIEEEEKILIYEYMPNKSLDFFLFGIARGLLYLHQDSRLRIIHRDLKAGSILLDDELNPKISDFGMARIFKGDQTEANTTTVVGTYGYMSPEYAMDGLFSVKSDVFSYGVLAWKLWKEGKGLELMDESMSGTCSTYEVLKCIQIGLLCVEEHVENRPTVSSVLLMLGSDTAVLGQPKKPGFSLGRTPDGADSSSNDQE